MPDEIAKPKLEVIDGQPKPDANPASVFDDLAALRRVSKHTVQRKTVLVNVTVDRPAANDYFRCSRDHVLDDCTVLRDNEGTSQTYYFVVPAMRGHPKLAPRLRRVTLVLTSLWPSGNVLIWPVPILGEREFPAWKSARAAYELARDQWVTMAWSQERNDYVIECAEEKGIDHQPQWPDKTFNEFLKLGFDGKIIDNEDHGYVRRLRGLID